ncbi:MAG: NUDIX hydrolase [bacterium]|nr:NUDIX hydrolase [bacterium]
MKKGLIVHALLYNQKHEVLLIRRSLVDDVLPGMWDIPGGTLEDGEDLQNGAVREVKEETGLDIKNLNLFHYTSNVDQTKDIEFIRLIFIGQCDDTEIVLNPEDHDEYRWVSLDKPLEDIAMVEYLPDLIQMLQTRDIN